LETPYQKWVKEDVAYIIQDEERRAFERLETNAERENFIEQFWQRRDPTPGTPANEYKEEHYRRIAYANEHFIEGVPVPGWKTDRGRIYIQYGPADEVTTIRPRDGGAGAEVWHYKLGPGGGPVDVTFRLINGAFRLIA